MSLTAYSLPQLGWSNFFAAHFQPYSAQGYSAGRVALEHRQAYRVYTAQGELTAELTGKLRQEALGRKDRPAVGDWVVLQVRAGEMKATIHAVLPRFSRFTRKVAGQRTEEQIVGANINTVFLVTSLNNDFNLRRLERFLTTTWESGANPVIVLSKADLCAEVETRMAEVEAIAYGVPIYAISALRNEGLGELVEYCGPGQTVAVLGSSGVGKSTLINRLLGQDLLPTKEIRASDDRGRHTTTHRELIRLPQGGLILDTPGMRELQLWDGAEGIREVFDDIALLAQQCFFRDCQHQQEPDCAVRAALEDGLLDADRYQNYEKLQRELRYLEVKRDYHAQAEQKKQWKKLIRAGKERSHMKRRGGQ